MPIDQVVYMYYCGSEEYKIRKITYDNHVTLELHATDGYHLDMLDSEKYDPEKFQRPPDLILAKAIIHPNVKRIIFCMGDEFPMGIPIYLSEFKAIRDFFDQIEAAIPHTENIEDSIIELEARNLLGTDKE